MRSMSDTVISRRTLAARLVAAPVALGLLTRKTRADQRELPPAAGSLTDVGGIRVGHFTDTRRPTGCTAILFDAPVVAGADYDGSAPGESLGVVLQPVSPLDRIHAILLTGGGPMALPATAGVVRYLEERGMGYDWGIPGIRIPIVVGAVIDDLAIGDGHIRPDAEQAYRACVAATGGPIPEGSVGVGSGATVGKMFVGRGMPGMKGGVGTASARFGDVIVAAMAVANSAGDILDWRTGRIVAGARSKDGRSFARSVDVLRQDLQSKATVQAPLADQPFRATTLSVVATNVALSKTQLTKLAMMANTGAARAINPYHTNGDGDQVLTVSTGALVRDVSLTSLGAIASEVVSDAILRAATTATALPGWTAAERGD